MSIEQEMQAALATFVTEASDLVQDIEAGLLGLEDEADPTDRIHALFRAMHTLKGSSGLFGLEHLMQFTHVVESILDSAREGQLPVTPELVSALLPCTDHISEVVDGIAGGRLDPTPAESETAVRLLATLRPFLDEPAAPAGAATADAADGSGQVDVDDDDSPLLWQLRLRFGEDCLRNGMDPVSFLRFLSTVGEVRTVQVHTDRFPEGEDFDPESCYLGFDVELASNEPKSAIDGVFDFVREDSEITVLPTPEAAELLAARLSALPQTGRLGELLLAVGVVSEREVEEAVEAQDLARAAGTDVPLLGALLVEHGATTEAIVDAALARQQAHASAADTTPATASAPAAAVPSPRPAGDTPPAPSGGASGGAKPRPDSTIRVDASRLDKLIDLVGELVIAQAGAGVQAAKGGTQLQEAQSEVMRLVEEVRDSALSLRMVPIGTTFRRFERVVRDVSADLGKEVSLVVTGGDSEVDKALVEKIGDPLLHLVRNSLDHGLEAPEQRAEAGKPTRGTLRLNAFHDSGTIVIEVVDDGRGLDRDRILAKAVERGLVDASATLSDQEVFALIFEPGFSTAEKLSNLSGRGVGMDVVRRNVTALRGTIEVESAVGVGTTMRIRLPLTLAIIDGFLVGVGSSSFVVPLDRVTECVELPPGPHRRNCMDLRGEVLPFIRLRDLFALDGEAPRRPSVVVVESGGVRTGLVVDALLGEFQTVIKPLGALFGQARGISGSTILGNGDAALILDVASLVAAHAERETQQPASSGRI